MSGSYNFDKKTTIGNWTVEIDSTANYGYFENGVTGTGGGLWFEGGELVDYDGVGVLPKSVIQAVNDLGYKFEDTDA